MAWSNIIYVGLLIIACAMAQERKNVLMIIADDMRPNLGVYEDANQFTSPKMVTPNLDALADQSLVLTRAYTQVALCGPSRNSFLTGRRADTTRCYVTEDKFRETGGEDWVTIPQFFKENGYLSLGVGKIFHPGIPGAPKGDDWPASWTEEIFHTETTDDDSISWKAITEEEMETTTLRDIANADYTIQKLQELAPEALPGIQPFFLAFGLHKPHMPWDFPEKFLDYYPEEDIQVPVNPYIPSDMPDSAWSTPTGLLNYPDCSAEGTGIENIGEPNVTYSDAHTKELRRAYYASISFADEQIGRVLQELNNLGLADNTVIIFLGDHGLHMGELSEWEKYTNFEVAHRAPMMLHVPGTVDTSIVTDKLVEFVDIFPTLVEAAGFDPMKRCDPFNSRAENLCREGTSLLELVRNPDEWKTAAFYQQPRGYWNENQHKYQGYTVVTEQYRYSEWVNLNDVGTEDQTPNWGDPQDFGELYDLMNDPLETTNLINNEEYDELIKELKQLLHQGWHHHN